MMSDHRKLTFNLTLITFLWFLPDHLNYDSAVCVMAEVDDRYIVALIMKHPDSHQVSAERGKIDMHIVRKKCN